MTDLSERSGDLARTVADLEGAPERSGLGARPPSRATRILTIAFALILAIGAFAVVLRAFRHGPVQTPGQDVTGPKANGVIWFRVGGGAGPSFIYEVQPDGSGERLVFGSEAEPLRHSQVAWSPDGARIAYVDPVAGSRGIYVSDPDSSDPQRLTDGANDRWPAWSPDGTKIAFSGTRHDPSAGPCTSTGDPDLLCPSDIYVMDADGSNATRLTTDPAPEYRPVWSPNGLRIAFTRTFNGSATAVYVMNADGTDARQVTSHEGGSDFAPSWSSDGSWLVFASIRFESWGIFVVNADGTGERAILAEGGFADEPAWSPDGELIAFVGSGFDGFPGGHALYVMRPDGSDITRLTTDALDEYGVAGDIAWQPLPSDGGTLTSPSPTAPSSPVEIGPAEPHASATIQIDADGRQITDMAADQGALWVMLTKDPGSGSSSLVRIDPVSNQVVAEIPLDGCRGELAAGAGAVWMLGIAANDRAVLCRIDPATDRVTATIPLPDGILGPIVASDEAVWIAHLLVPEGGEFDDASRSILRVDPIKNEIVATIPAKVCTLVDADCTPTWGSAGEAAVWFEGYRLGETVRVDPSANVATTIPTGASCGIAAGEGWAWVGVRAADGPTDVWNVAELVVRIDPRRVEIVGEPIPLAGGRPDPLTGTGCPYAAGAGALWVLGSERDTHRGLVARLDAQTLEFDFSMVISDDEYSWPEVAFDFDAEILWLGRDGTVTRIDLS